MDWLSLLSSLWGSGTALGGALGNSQQPGLVSLLQLLGMASGAYGQQEGANWLDFLTGAQKKAVNTAENPAAMLGLINKYFNAFTPTQNRAILGPVEQAAAARGQAGSPGQMQILSEQALAPFVNQQYQTAANIAENTLHLPFDLRPYQYPSFNPVGDLGALSKIGNPWGTIPQSGIASYANSFPESLGIPDPSAMGIAAAGWGQ